MIPFVREEQLNEGLFTFVKKENQELSQTKSWGRSLCHGVRGEKGRQRTGQEKCKEKSPCHGAE